MGTLLAVLPVVYGLYALRTAVRGGAHRPSVRLGTSYSCSSVQPHSGAGSTAVIVTMPRDLEKELNALRKQRENKQCPNCAAEDRYGFKSACVKFE